MAGHLLRDAYMLMYRLIDAEEDRSELTVHDDEIPSEVKQDVEESETKEL